MLNVGGFSLRAFVVGVRWARLKGWPEKVADWTQEHNDIMQCVCEEYDRRKRERLARKLT